MGYEVDAIALRVKMTKAGINTVEELSKRSGVNRNTLSDVLNGKTYPSSMVMSKIMIALSMTGDEAGRIFFKEKLA